MARVIFADKLGIGKIQNNADWVPGCPGFGHAQIVAVVVGVVGDVVVFVIVTAIVVVAGRIRCHTPQSCLCCCCLKWSPLAFLSTSMLSGRHRCPCARPPSRPCLLRRCRRCSPHPCRGDSCCSLTVRAGQFDTCRYARVYITTIVT